jgi:hypothetical protein
MARSRAVAMDGDVARPRPADLLDRPHPEDHALRAFGVGGRGPRARGNRGHGVGDVLLEAL